MTCEVTGYDCAGCGETFYLYSQYEGHLRSQQQTCERYHSEQLAIENESKRYQQTQHLLSQLSINQQKSILASQSAAKASTDAAIASNNALLATNKALTAIDTVTATQ